MSYVDALVCKGCGKKYTATKMRYKCDFCVDFLHVTYQIEKMKNELDRDKIVRRNADIMTKCLEFLPIEEPALIKKVSLGEMETLLIESFSL